MQSEDNLRAVAAGTTGMLHVLLALAVAAILLGGCATTYWWRAPMVGGFNQAEFDRDVAQCKRNYRPPSSGGNPFWFLHFILDYRGTMHECLAQLGYIEISRDEAERLGLPGEGH